jgi:PIN domain nuclease of toxin-antitoxin system
VTILLDTHIWWWWVTGDGDLSSAQKRRLAKIGPHSPALVSDISLWEIATLHSLIRFIAIPPTGSSWRPPEFTVPGC